MKNIHPLRSGLGKIIIGWTSKKGDVTTDHKLQSWDCIRSTFFNYTSFLSAGLIPSPPISLSLMFAMWHKNGKKARLRNTALSLSKLLLSGCPKDAGAERRQSSVQSGCQALVPHARIGGCPICLALLWAPGTTARNKAEFLPSAVEIKVPANSAPGETSSGFADMPSCCVLTHHLITCVTSSSSSKGANPVRGAAPSQPNYFPRASPLTPSHWGLGLPNTTYGVTRTEVKQGNTS